MHATYAIDAGGVANRGAARLADGQSATFADVDDAVVALAVDLSTRPVALGIEAPLWIPIGPTVADATRARPIDRARAWSAAAGAAVLASGLGILASALSIIAQRVPSTRVTVSPEAWRNGDAELLIYEAFISSDRQPLPPDAMSLIQTDDVDDPHQLDALYATAAFDWQITGAPEKQPDPVLGRVVNLATACVTAAGLRLVGPQHLPCVVVCARKRERRGAA